MNVSFINFREVSTKASQLEKVIDLLVKDLIVASPTENIAV